MYCLSYINLLSSAGHTCNIRNVLYFFPQSQKLLDSDAKSKFITHSPPYVVLSWLENLYRQNKEYQKLRDEGINILFIVLFL